MLIDELETSYVLATLQARVTRLKRDLADTEAALREVQKIAIEELREKDDEEE